LHCGEWPVVVVLQALQQPVIDLGQRRHRKASGYIFHCGLFADLVVQKGYSRVIEIVKLAFF
jgi:hypothetical protein